MDTPTAEFHIRAAVPSDAPAIEAINRRAWGGEITTHELLQRRHGELNGMDWTESIAQAVAEHLARPDVTVFVAEHNDHVIGYASAQISCEPTSDMGTVSYNAVDPDFHGQGVGTALIEHVMVYLRAKRVRVMNVVTIESDAPAMHIYEKLGFKKLTSLIYYTRDC